MVRLSPDSPAGEQAMKQPTTAFTTAAAELAETALHRQFDTTVTVDAAREYVDAKVMTDWLVAEALSRDMEIILADTIAQRLTTEHARSVLCALIVGHAASVQDTLQAALVEQVARDLAYAAGKLVDAFDPTDAEMARDHYPSFVDDPVRRDQSALADCVNSALRMARMCR